MPRVLTGDRPTGALHLGHYFGSLANRVTLQRAGHEVFVVVADYQVLSDRDHPGDLRAATYGLVADYLACGLDPDTTVIFPHSAVPALNELLLALLSLTSLSELRRNPTVKEEITLSGRSSVSGLMLTYPVHQAADVLFCHANLVPVGRDQLPHLELTRTLARRFNDRYGAVFALPEPLLGEEPSLTGFDGRKMSKSLRNGIALSDPPDVVARRVRAARTDAEREINYDPQARPEVANLLRIAALCSGQRPERIAAQLGDAGAAALKDLVITAVTEFLAPLGARRAEVSDQQIRRILAAGTCLARDVARRTLAEVHDALGMRYLD